MSLFGDDNNNDSLTASATTRGAKSSLFDDNSNSHSKPASSSMFGDDDDGAGTAAAAAAQRADDSSPWGFTPRKLGGANNEVVKNLLQGADADVPELYVDRFDAMQSGGGIVAAGDARRMLAESGVAESAQVAAWDLVSNRGQSAGLGRGEMNVLLALVGLAQEGEEVSLDAVDERRRKLPLPRLPAWRGREDDDHNNNVPVAQKQPGEDPTGPAFEAGFAAENDPWASPAAQKARAHVNGVGGRTTSTFTTSAAESGDAAGSGGSFSTAGAGGAGSASWGGAASSYGAGGDGGFGASSSSAGGFGGDDGHEHAPPRRTGPGRTTSKGAEEVVTVQLLEEKEGVFMFQHRNYEVSSVRRNSKVIRRYSDFVWLLDCLHKRYPFRQLPLLPPKRVQINGNHIAADSSFLEKRRKGLARFANSLIRHPVLREEQLVVMFLTVPTELAVWRKQATVSVQEEFVGRGLPPGLEDSLPQNLLEMFDTVRSGVRRSADLYIILCNVTERLCKRKEATAGEYGRFSAILNSLTETSADTYAIDTNDVPLLNEGVKSTAKHLETSRALLEDEARAWEEGVLEDLKTMRDGLVSMRDMFDRRDRFARDNIPQLEKRIVGNEQKLGAIKAKGDAAKPGEAERVENAIINDKQSIVDQHARGVFIKECMRDELLYFQNSISRASHLHQDWAQERVKYAELQADNFRGLVDAVESMPLGD